MVTVALLAQACCCCLQQTHRTWRNKPCNLYLTVDWEENPSTPLTTFHKLIQGLTCVWKETFKWLKAASLIIKAQCTGIVNLPMKVHLTIWMLSPLCCRSNTVTLIQGPIDMYYCKCFLLLWDHPARQLIWSGTPHFKTVCLKHLCYTTCHFSQQNDGPLCWRIIAGYVIYMFLIKDEIFYLTKMSMCLHGNSKCSDQEKTPPEIRQQN